MTEANDKPKKSFKDTLNLPKTDFAMKANLVQREPQFQQRWAQLDVYNKLRAAAGNKKKFYLHDGPPYANGSIHLGHLLNKVLKDLVVRSRSMLGFDAPFIPGWDCHGLPIEHKVMKDLGSKARAMSAVEIRKHCQQDAEKFVKLQSGQMQRLGTIADYANPYLTMDPKFEAGSLELFSQLVGKGLVFRQLKPVHWSIANRTALAEAELEYMDREDTSVYVMFEVANPQKLPGGLMARPDFAVSLMIWTTTPWTLPANLAVAAAPQAEYGLYRWEHEGRMATSIVAVDLAEKVFGSLGAVYDMMGMCSGAELEAAGIQYQHPFLEKINPLVTAEYVTLQDGTGLVHTAPGHGVEDYQTGLRYKMEIYCPVMADGKFDDTAPEWLRGKSVWDANPMVVEHLKQSGHLFREHKFMHSYPHDWRSKTPVIFRATEQWFIGVDRPFSDGPSGRADLTLRRLALAATDPKTAQINFIPEWGRNRMRGMLESRPDWCISRQRSWGLPIPAFFNKKGETLMTACSVKAVADQVRQHGSDIWYTATPEELLKTYDPSKDPAAPDWLGSEFRVPSSALTKGADIFDVWFDSGSTWYSVMHQRGQKHADGQVDLYLEGSDQHRGWFQSSLLPSLGAMGRPIFRNVLTHGFMVDAHGQKMSKSLGNALEVDTLMKEHGADVCRWWVCSLNFANDIKVDPSFFKLAGEEYRKVRNTIRFLLSNLYDFDPRKDAYTFTDKDATSIDAWALGELNRVIDEVRGGYERYDFALVRESIFTFCNESLSSIYMAATKDRLYCDKADSPRRRRTQAAMHAIADALIRLIAPVMVHTADEAFLALHGRTMEDSACIHLELLPQKVKVVLDNDWSKVMKLRDEAMKKLELARQNYGIDNPLDCGLSFVNNPQGVLLYEKFQSELADLFGISQVHLSISDSQVQSPGLEFISGVENLKQLFELGVTRGLLCDRSRKRDGTVKTYVYQGEVCNLSARDANVLGLAW